MDYSSHPGILRKDLKTQYYSKRTEDCKISGNFLDYGVKCLDECGFPKNKDLVDPKANEMSICLS